MDRGETTTIAQTPKNSEYAPGKKTGKKKTTGYLKLKQAGGGKDAAMGG